jgi:hypothetical protein
VVSCRRQIGVTSSLAYGRHDSNRKRDIRADYYIGIARKLKARLDAEIENEHLRYAKDAQTSVTMIQDVAPRVRALSAERDEVEVVMKSEQGSIAA